MATQSLPLAALVRASGLALCSPLGVLFPKPPAGLTITLSVPEWTRVLRHWMSTATCPRSPRTDIRRHGTAHILGVSDCLQMVGVDAARGAAQVVDFKTIGNQPDPPRVCPSVGRIDPAAIGERAITTRAASSYPKPTPIGKLDLLHKPLKSRSHAGDLASVVRLHVVPVALATTRARHFAIRKGADRLGLHRYLLSAGVTGAAATTARPHFTAYPAYTVLASGSPWPLRPC